MYEPIADPDVTAFALSLLITVVLLAFALGHLITEIYFRFISKLIDLSRKQK